MNEPTEQMSETVPVKLAYNIDQIPAAGISGQIKATKEQREEIAAMLNLLELDDFRFDFLLHRAKKGRFNLKGRLIASFVQNCVVTLEPVPAHIEEAVDVDLWPAKDVEHLEEASDPESMSLQLEGPEPINGDCIDVGLLAYEHLAASLDLYPKITNAKHDWSDGASGEVDDGKDNPFSILADLKVKPVTD